MAIKKAKATDKALTKTAIIATLTAETGLAKKDVVKTLDTLVELAYAQAIVGFTLPGLGKLKIVQRKARTGINPLTKAPIKIAAKKVVKFTVAKAAKDAIVGPRSNFSRNSWFAKPGADNRSGLCLSFRGLKTGRTEVPGPPLSLKGFFLLFFCPPTKRPMEPLPVWVYSNGAARLSDL